MTPKTLFEGKPVLKFRDELGRRKFLRGAALIGVGSSFALTRAADPLLSALAQEGSNDVEILNFALTLERLEAEFYRLGLAADILDGEDLELVTPIRDHERTHVVAVTDTIEALGGTPVEEVEFTFPDDTFESRNNFLEQAMAFEELGVNAYHGQVPRIQSTDVLSAAGSIAGVESRHAAIIRVLLDEQPFPNIVEVPRPMSFVLEQADPFIED